MPDQIPTPKELMEAAEQSAAEQDDTQGTAEDTQQTAAETGPSSKAANDDGAGADDTDASEAASAQSEDSEETASDDSDGSEVDWKSQSRKHERRAKDYKSKLDAADRENADLKSQLETVKLRYEVANSKKVPVELLQGATKEELEEHAEKLLAFGGKQETRTGPVVPESGTGSDGPIDTEAQKALAALGFK